jgi:hypothetical protein
MRNVINSLKNLFGNLFYGATYDTRTGQETINWPTPKAEYSPAPPQQPYSPTPTPTPQQQYNSNQASTFNIPYQTDNETKMVPGGLSQSLGDIWTSGQIGPSANATESASILSHPYGEQVKGYGRGENQDFQVVIDVPNRINEKGDWDPNAPIKTFESKFPSLGTLQSIDRGLFRINNESFLTYLAGKNERKKMYDAGIIDNPHDSWEGLTPETINKYWDYMNDPVKNMKMAKLIFDKQGAGAWYAAPIGLVNKGNIANK